MQHFPASRLAGAIATALLAGGCATAHLEPTAVHTMPSDLSRALPPAAADPDKPAELAEAALHLLHRDRPGGPDYAGAARLCLMAADSADDVVERDLKLACYRVAARSALRVGERDIYLEAVNGWARRAPRHESATGELAIHIAIRDRLSGSEPGTRIPKAVRVLLTATENAP